MCDAADGCMCDPKCCAVGMADVEDVSWGCDPRTRPVYVSSVRTSGGVI